MSRNLRAFQRGVNTSVKKVLIATIIYSVLIVSAVSVFLFINNDKEINIHQGKEELKKVETLISKEDNKANKDDDAGYGHNDEVVKMFETIDGTLNFFVATLQEENEEYFASFFSPQQYSKDLWANSSNPYADKVSSKFMRELNRNGTLVSAKYDTNLMEGFKSTRESSDVKLTLIYKDGKEATLNLKLVLMGTEHSNKDDIYYIKNSVLDLIEQVKKQT